MTTHPDTNHLTALTIGNFDAAHLGHTELIRRARLAVGPEGRVIALAFHPHPATVLAPAKAPVALTTFQQRARTLRELGADRVHRLEPTPELLATPPDAFIRDLARRFRPAVIVEGADFRFGKRRAGDTETLRTLGQQLHHEHLGFETIIVDPVQVPLSNGILVTASSTIARWLIARGRTADAARVLGRPHRIEGTVTRGDQLGRTIGVPTANITTTNPLPADGVYAALAHLPEHRTIPAALHIGPRKTLHHNARTVEAHIIDWAGPGTNTPDQPPVYEYNWPIAIDTLAYIRDQARYDSLEELTAQMQRDINRARDIAERHLARQTNANTPPDPLALAATHAAAPEQTPQ